jgi:hypothetical protein
MKILYKFYWDCGRQGDVDGTFVATEEEVAAAMGKEVYFGEILGKHSEIFGTLEEKDLKVLTDDQKFIEMFEKLVGDVGHNPLRYLSENR